MDVHLDEILAGSLRDGYSTAGTLGTGLGAIQRLSDQFELITTEGKGTAICTRISLVRCFTASAE